MKTKQARRVNKIVNFPVNLPNTYRDLFKFTYKTNFFLILKLSLMISLFSLPFLISVLFKGIIESSIMSVEGKTNEELLSTLMTFRGVYSLAVLLGFIILSIGLAGVFYVLKKYLTNEGMNFKRDFKLGIKKHALKYILITAFLGFILCIFNFILNIPQFINYYSALLVLFVIVSILFMGVYFICLQIELTYEVRFFKMIKNGFLILISRLPNILLMLICSISLLVVFYMVPVALAKYICLLCYIGIGFGNAALVISLFSLRILDETVNVRQFPEIYRKGLFKAEDSEIKDEGFVDEIED